MTSSAHSNWARGGYSSFQLNVRMRLLWLPLPPCGIEFNATANLLTVLRNQVENSSFPLHQSGSIRSPESSYSHFDPLVLLPNWNLLIFLSRAGSFGLPGFEYASGCQLLEKNGTILNKWPDISGNARGLIKSVGPLCRICFWRSRTQSCRFDGCLKCFL